MSYKAPVLLFTYRKPQFLEEIFRAIEQYAPPRLYVVSNQYSNEEEIAVVSSIRAVIKNWRPPCGVELIFREQHLLINDSIHSGLDYVFGIEDAAIILEDDTVPSPSFFSFCNTMLERHRGNPETGSIIGCNLGLTSHTSAFTTPLAIFYWGWATWADKWNQNRAVSTPWGTISHYLPEMDRELQDFLNKLDDRTTWDIKWGVNQAVQGQHAIISGSNLVSNKGFVKEGSYVRYRTSRFKDLPLYSSNEPSLSLVENIDQKELYIDLSKQLLKEILLNRGEIEKYFPNT